MVGKFKFDHPEAAIRALAGELKTVGVEGPISSLVSRTLAEEVVADRPSPAADVSAMDGYALRLSDLQNMDTIPVDGESTPGAPPPELKPQSAVRIFTGAIVPTGSEVVLKREDTEELETAIRPSDAVRSTAAGEHIRRTGENSVEGQTVVSAGTLVTAATSATMANFGVYQATVRARVKVAVITSGNEVGLFEDDSPAAWQLRNSNRFSIAALLTQPWIQITTIQHCLDDRDRLAKTLAAALEQSDAVIMSGGVSMGDYDYVPDVVSEAGGNIVFHGLPIRPGKPILGAATNAGKLILGLPGNPVSATVCCQRVGIPLLAKIGGQTPWLRPQPRVLLDDAGDKTIPLHWMRLVRIDEDGSVVAVQSKGSGDLVSLGQSSGFVETPPGESGSGPWPYWAW